VWEDFGGVLLIGEGIRDGSSATVKHVRDWKITLSVPPSICCSCQFFYIYRFCMVSMLKYIENWKDKNTDK
jgi:hypothetical protein